MIDDGTVSRLDEQLFRWTAADPSLRWFRQNAVGLRVSIEDVSEEHRGAGASRADLGARVARGIRRRYRRFEVLPRLTATIAGVTVDISRTGYTGDLGYEIWMPAADALRVWDVLMDVGRPFDIKPAGMLALDVARIEAGLLLIDVDFFGSKKALIASQKYTPFEMGLDRLVSPTRAVSSASRRCSKSVAAARRAGSSGSRSSGLKSRASTSEWACRRRSVPQHRASRCPSTAAIARSGGRQRRRGRPCSRK